MTTRKIQVTVKKVDELMAFFRALPAQPVGDHLSDDEFIDYSMETLPAEQVARIDTHLASCPDCATEMERLLEASEAWRGEQGKQRLAALRERLLGQLPTPEQPTRPPTPPWWERLAAKLRDQIVFPNVGLPGGLAPARAATKTPWRDGQTGDGTLRWRAVEDEDGNLIIRFGSHALELEGARVRLQAGEWQGEVVLLKVAPDQVGAEIEIARNEREQLPADVDLRTVELTREDLDAGQAG